MNHLGNKHDTDCDSRHEIHLQILAPFIGPNPAAAREEELNPFKISHSSKLRGPIGEHRIEIRRRQRRRYGRVLQGDDPDGTIGRQRRRHRRPHGGGIGAEVGATWRCVGYLHAPADQITSSMRAFDSSRMVCDFLGFERRI